MTKQDMQASMISIVVIMAGLALGYIVTVILGLFIISHDLKESKPVTIHITNTIQPNEKILPESLTFTNPEPEVIQEPPVSEDLNVLAHIINAEAGDQPYDGKLAVGNVILNRVDSPQFPDTIKDVVYQKGQFSPVSNGSIHNSPNDESIQAAKEVLDGRRVVHEDVLFFYNPDISTSRWIFSREVVTKIGSHAFAL